MNEPKRSLADLFAGQTAGRRAEDGETPDFASGAAALFERIAAESASARAESERAVEEVAFPDLTRRARPGGSAVLRADAVPVQHAPETTADRAVRTGWFRRPVIWLAVAAVVLSLAFVVAVAVLQTMERAEQDENEAALTALEASDDALADARADLDAALIRITEAKDRTLGLIGRADAVVAAVTGASDETARAGAAAAAASYRTGVEGVALPAPPDLHERGDLDAGSASAIAAELSEVESEREAVEALAIRAEQAEGELTRLSAEFATAWNSFLASFPAHAASVVGENGNAEESFRVAVTAGGAAVAAPITADLPGEAETQAYVAAVAALLADEARAIEQAADDRGEEAREVVPPPADPLPVTPPPPVEPTPEPTPDPPTP
ncbi:hypothetical protein [Microbacterium sp. SD291]|uniref:hypothetical protein n=1 Tax=Microbacterium sp. SD291 TaxID=2782007 RepID=UPI001A958B32|nr:hypothetical protein [Microbacterium sp. SD291]MBO0980967.1 hypothetical protein [Microbacterium sp. SD291]